MKTTKGSTALQCLNLTSATNKLEVTKLLKKTYKKVDEDFKPAKKPDSERLLV